MANRQSGVIACASVPRYRVDVLLAIVTPAHHVRLCDCYCVRYAYAILRARLRLFARLRVGGGLRHAYTIVCVLDTIFTSYSAIDSPYTPYRKILFDFSITLVYNRRMFTASHKPKEPTFEDVLADAENMAPGLSDEEVFAILNIVKDDLEKDQMDQLTLYMLRGRAMANKKAVDYLFGQMSSKGGEKACIDYLKRFGEKWPEDAQYDSDKVATFKAFIA